MDAQQVINGLFGLVCAGLGFFLKTLWQAVKDLQIADKQIVKDVSELQVVVAGSYVRKDEFSQGLTAVFAKLDKMADKIDRIDDKLDTKADK
jgi:hypothetical protein